VYFLGFISLHYLNHFQQIWLADVYALQKLLYEIVQSLRCVLLFECIQPESSFQLFLENRVSQWVGKLSFPIYLLHSWARDFSQLVNPTRNEGILLAQTLLLALPVAQAFTLVDGWAILKSKDVAAFFIKPPGCLV
jgi:peptidoglycan/LPS O-acetylase OafA/YrhL